MRFLTCITIICLFIQCKDEVITQPNPIIEPNTAALSGDEFLNLRSPKVQKFTRNIDKAFSLTTEKGLIFEFDIENFLLPTGAFAKGNVEISVTEYNSKAEMVFSGVTTTHYDRILASGGMFNIEVTQNGDKLIQNPQNFYKVSIPTESRDLQMRIFRGEMDPQSPKIVKWYTNDPSWIQQDSFGDQSPYLLHLNFLNWVNLDKFVDGAEGTRVRLKVPEGYNNINTTVYMLLDTKSVVRLFGDVANKEFNTGSYRLPIGWNVKLLAVAVVEGQLQYALKEVTTIAGFLETATTFTTISEVDLEILIKNL